MRMEIEVFTKSVDGHHRADPNLDPLRDRAEFRDVFALLGRLGEDPSD